MYFPEPLTSKLPTNILKIIRAYAGNKIQPEMKTELCIESSIYNINRAWNRYFMMKREIAMMMDEEEEEKEHEQPCQKSILIDRIGESQFNHSLYALMNCTCCGRHMMNRPNISKLPNLDVSSCQIRNIYKHRTSRKRNVEWREPDCMNICHCPCRHYLRYYLKNRK